MKRLWNFFEKHFLEVLFVLTIAAFVVLIFRTPPAHGGWGSGVYCPPEQFVPLMHQQTTYRLPDVWSWHDMEDGNLALRCNGPIVGAWNVRGGFYQPYTGGVWGPATAPPWPVPAAYTAKTETPKVIGQADPLNFGLERDKIGDDAPAYSVNGKWCSKRDAYELIQDKSLVDDSKKLRITVVGTEAKCTPVMTDLKSDSALKEITKDIVVRDYRPDHWHVDGVFATGDPAIYYQQADGTVLARWESYPGAQQFGEQLRKSHPDYDPKRDPDGKPTPPVPVNPNNPNPNNPTPTPGNPSIDLAQVHPLIWVALIGVSFGVYMNWSKKQ
jgi:hypothetical protein